MLIKNENGKPQSTYKPNTKPVILKFNENVFDLDPVLKYLRKAMIKNTPNNREFAFWNDSLCQSMTEITSAVIIGNGLKVHVDGDPKAEEIIRNWNNEINVNGKTIEDWIRSSWFDEVVHGRSFWRIGIDPIKYKNKVDIARIDPKTLKKYRDPHEGWQAFIQEVITYKSHRSKKQFYRSVLDEYEANLQYGYIFKKIMIPDEPDVLLRTSYFIKAPTASIIHFVTGKRWTMFFMRKYAQKHWSPWLIATVGDPKSNFYPDDPEDMQEAMDKMESVLPKVTNWGGVVIPGIVSIKALETGSAKSAQIYREAIDIYDKQIMLGLFASMAMRDASGNEQSTQRGIFEGWLTFLEGVRRKFAVTLSRFYSKTLLPAHGKMNIEASKIHPEFGTLRRTGYLEIAQAIERLNNAGIWKDDNEARRASSILFDFIKELPKGQNKKRGQNMLKLGGGGMFGGAGMGSQKNPQATRATSTKMESNDYNILMGHIGES